VLVSAACSADAVRRGAVVAERGAYVLPRVTFAAFGPLYPWVRTASDGCFGACADRVRVPQRRRGRRHRGAENTREGSDIEPRRMQLIRRAHRIMDRFISGDAVSPKYRPRRQQDAA
jgi:hypothetical protein